MIVIDNILISDALVEEEFVCNLVACKGACCVEGDNGAPLEPEEADVLRRLYKQVKPYLTAEGKAVIRKEGHVTEDADGTLVTPLIGPRGPCAYIQYTPDGTAICGIERAYLDGKIEFRKPISCHLYPVRITRREDYEMLNYDRWDICAPACSNGQKLGVPVYQFVKTALLRKYGATFYERLETAVEYLEE